MWGEAPGWHAFKWSGGSGSVFTSLLCEYLYVPKRNETFTGDEESDYYSSSYWICRNEVMIGLVLHSRWEAWIADHLKEDEEKRHGGWPRGCGNEKWVVPLILSVICGGASAVRVSRMTLKAPPVCTAEHKPLLALVLSAVRHRLLWEWGFQSMYEKAVSVKREWDRITHDGGSGCTPLSRCSKAKQLSGRNCLVLIRAISRAALFVVMTLSWLLSAFFTTMTLWEELLWPGFIVWCFLADKEICFSLLPAKAEINDLISVITARSLSKEGLKCRFWRYIRL